MSIYRFLSRQQTASRRTSEISPKCESLEHRTLLTVSTFSNASLADAPVFQSWKSEVASPANELGIPEPTGTSPYSGLSAPSFAPQVFKDAATARSQQGLDGSGLTVAFIDTGIDYQLAALGGGFGPNNRVIAGYDFGMNDGNPLPTWDHGTGVAGVVSSTNPANPGIAPGADIVALRVFDDSGNSTFFRIADALEWVVANHSNYRISVVNISLSDPSNHTLNWFAKDTSAGQRITDAISTLRGMNIPVVSASGNSFNGSEGMGFTAIVKDTISVTGVDPQTNQIASNAQRLGTSVAGDYATDIAAPSSGFNVLSGSGQLMDVDGTSFAAPIVSGSILLMQQKYRESFGVLPSVNQIEAWLKQSGDPTSDPITHLQIPQVDLAGALALVPSNKSTPLPVINPTIPIAPVNLANSQISVVPNLASPATNPEPLPAPALTVKINGRSVEPGSQTGTINLNSLQSGVKWTSVQVWDGSAIANQSAASNKDVLIAGKMQKIQDHKVALQMRRATRLAKISAIRKQRLA